jgi:hypothetical protein
VQISCTYKEIAVEKRKGEKGGGIVAFGKKEK